MNHLPQHECDLMHSDECTTCEDYFWSTLAKTDDDYAGLDRFLERRVEAIRPSDTRSRLEKECERDAQMAIAQANILYSNLRKLLS